MCIRDRTCAYLYLPRLLDSQVLRQTLAAGAVSRDFFGLAYGRDGDRYVGFQYGTATTPILDDSLLLVEPKAAEAFDKVLHAEEEERKAAIAIQVGGHAVLTTGTSTSTPSRGMETPVGPGYKPEPPKAAKRRSFFGTVELNPLQPKPQFGDVVDEIVMLLNRSDVRLTISVEIQAECENGFDEGVQRAVRENCNQLKFKNGGFED